MPRQLCFSLPPLRLLPLSLLLLAMQLATAAFAFADETPQLVEWTVATETGTDRVVGRQIAVGQDGTVLVEDRAGRLRMLRSATIRQQQPMGRRWEPFSDMELAQLLLAETGDEFTVTQTEHYLIVANSNEDYAEFCGKLLEKVYSEYAKLMQQLEVPVQFSEQTLPVLIFASTSEFQAHAERMHPEVSFDDTPGFYSVRENQVLLQDLTRDRGLKGSAAIRKKLADQPLQVATIVHEAVHQLAFNSGVQVRLADNPVWFSEGLALCFEQTTPRTPLLWTRPNLVNARHHSEFVRLAGNSTAFIPFEELIQHDRFFQQSEAAAAAYAESWGLTTWLIRERPKQLAAWIGRLRQLSPLQPVTPAERTEMFIETIGISPEHAAPAVIAEVRKLRAPR
jgi:hypothetical protein